MTNDYQNQDTENVKMTNEYQNPDVYQSSHVTKEIATANDCQNQYQPSHVAEDCEHCKAAANAEK